MRTLDQFHRLLERIEFTLVALLMATMVGLVVLAVFMRYLVGAPLIFSYDLSTLLFAWTVFVGLALAERQKAHLSVGVIDEVLPPRADRALKILRQLLVIVISVFATWFGWKLFQRAGMVIPSMRISIGWLYASLPIGFALLVLAQIKTLMRIVTGHEETES